MPPTPEHARVGARLADPALVTAAVTRYQQMTALADAQRKAGGLPTQPPRQLGSLDSTDQGGGGGGDAPRRQKRKGRGAGRGTGAAAAADEEGS